MNRPSTIAAAALLAATTGCIEPAHLQDTHGLSYTQAFTQQPDLGRASAQEGGYALTGTEGLEVKARSAEAATDASEIQSVSGEE